MEASINASINSTTHETPHFVIFGTDKKLPYELLESNLIPLYSDDLVRVNLRNFQEIYRAVKANLAASKEDMVKEYNKRAKDAKMAPGDIVFLKVNEREDKLSPKFEGPYRIVSRNRNTLVVVSLFKGEERRVHVENVKRVDRRLAPEESTVVAKPKPSTSVVPPTHPMTLRPRPVSCCSIFCDQSRSLHVDLFSFYA